MSFAQELLSRTRPERVRDLPCRPQRQSYFPSPVDWRDQVLYFLLVDRFSDGREEQDQRAEGPRQPGRQGQQQDPALVRPSGGWCHELAD